MAEQQVANAVQAQRWNGDTGRRWIAQRERHAAVRQRLMPYLLRAAAVRPGDRVLEVGCGCGELTVALARAARPGGRVLGLDLSGPILAVARRLAAEAGAAEVRFVRGDAQVRRLPAAAYDVVVSGFGVMFFDDPAAAFGNLLGALRPDGRLAFLCWQDELDNEVFSIPLRACLAHSRLTGVGGGDPFADPGWVSALLGRVGYTDVQVVPVREPARIGMDVSDVLGYLCDTSRVRELMARLGDESAAAWVRAAMAEQLTERQRPDGVWVEAAAWLVTAVAPG
ncbi:class I SAM-dependent methyltransferase [Rugosimonospora africana]|uniref:Methyltransferase n=1 Tax=Rugosimonospora africana TaxID=556532 RepID=A0A8J3QZS6_9ACTN|nr:class I SAM-dependent methyltransferase [Rugosimonospora africana]GIH18893.1 methyltransferase [Rugosimonospora africana]